VRPPERPPVLIRWIARPDACADCKRIAAGSPYERLPTWPGLGDTRCAVCRCSVEGTRAGNVMAPASGAAASRPPQPAATPAAVVPPPSATIADAAPLADAAALAMPAEFTPAATAIPDPAPPAKPANITALRIAPLERRWTLALGALIFIAIVAALIGR